MIHDTAASWAPVAWIDTAEQVHYPVRVHIENPVRPATRTRPRHHGAWFIEAYHLERPLRWSREMDASFDHASSAPMAMHHDANHHQTQIPALAAYHPDLGVSGLSHEVGGWLAGRPLRYEQPLFPGCFPQVRAVSEQRLARYRSAGKLAIADLPSQGAFAVPAVSADRVKAMLLGVAIGDALGSPSESMTASDRQARFGWIETITDPAISDDTQLTLRSLHALFREGRADPAALNRAWTAARIEGIGGTLRTALRQQAPLMRAQSDPWDGRVSGHAAGNGSLMRVAGVLAPYALCHPESVTADLLLASALSHDDRTANAACLGWAALLLALGQREAITRPEEVFAVFLQAARPVEGERNLRSRSPHLDFTGSLCDFIEQQVLPAHQAPATLSAVRDTWYSGAFLLETLPTVLSIIAQYLDDPRRAILEAVNRTWDNDTAAGLVASAMGMRHGQDAFDRPWCEAMLGYRPAHEDDGLDAAFALLEPF